MLSSGRLLLSIGQQPSDVEAIQLLCPEPLLSDGQQPSNIEATPILCAQTNTSPLWCQEKTTEFAHLKETIKMFHNK